MGLRPTNGHETLAHPVIPSGARNLLLRVRKKQIPRFARNDRRGTFISIGGPRAHGILLGMTGRGDS
jgi:hypothetical protein